MKSLEKKYLKEALVSCRECWDGSAEDECTKTCATKYLYFMQLKEFVLKGKASTISDVERIEKIVEGI